MRSYIPDALPAPFARYAHATEWPAGHRLLRSSGQLAIDHQGHIPQGARAQAELIFAHLDAILAEADMTRADICHLTTYVTDRAHMAGYMAARDAYLADCPADSLPSSTLLIVGGFTRPEFVVEIELWAAAA
ncbi:MAG: RidA family protein [Marinibacterium sp.]|nr:RidA family protein [Marinibacterium sp.]